MRGMDFVALTLGLVFLLFLILVGLGRAFQSHSVADFLDWKPTRSPEVEAQNEYRRRRGAKELTREDVERQAREDQRVRARGRGPFSQQGEVMDELDQPRRPKRANNKQTKAKRSAKTSAARTASRKKRS